MVKDFLKLAGRRLALTRGKVSLATEVNWIEYLSLWGRSLPIRKAQLLAEARWPSKLDSGEVR